MIDIDTLLALQSSPAPDSWQDIAETLKGIHTGIQNNKSLLFSLIGIIIGGLITLSGIFISRTTSARQERKALKGILEDLYRHFHANILVLDKIDLDKGIPSRLYLGRFKVDDASMVFCDDICNSIKRKHLHEFNQLRLIYRNGNIELDVVCEYLVSGRYDKTVMRQYMDLVRIRQERLRKATRKFRISMEKGKEDRINFMDAVPTPDEIVYEEQKQIL